MVATEQAAAAHLGDEPVLLLGPSVLRPHVHAQPIELRQPTLERRVGASGDPAEALRLRGQDRVEPGAPRAVVHVQPVGDYVEIQDDYSVLNNIPGNLLRVQSIDRTNFVVVLSGVTTAAVATDQKLHPLMRRWDHKPGDPAQGGAQVLPDGALPVTGGTWLDLEDGVQVWFEVLRNVAVTYRSADYWLIPARVATGDVIRPSDTDSQGNLVTGPAAMPLDGVTHHYVSLATVAPDGNGTIGTGQTASCLAD